jgi:hypothetical protein
MQRLLTLVAPEITLTFCAILVPDSVNAANIPCALEAPLRPSLRSMPLAWNADSFNFTFVNGTSYPVHINWIDYSGSYQFVHELQSNHSISEFTFTTFPWIITYPSGQCLQIIIPEFQAPPFTIGNTVVTPIQDDPYRLTLDNTKYLGSLNSGPIIIPENSGTYAFILHLVDGTSAQPINWLNVLKVAVTQADCDRVDANTNGQYSPAGLNGFWLGGMCPFKTGVTTTLVASLVDPGTNLDADLKVGDIHVVGFSISFQVKQIAPKIEAFNQPYSYYGYGVNPMHLNHPGDWAIFAVRVTDSSGQPVNGVHVAWTQPDSDTAAVRITGENGAGDGVSRLVFNRDLKVNDQPGSYTLLATIVRTDTDPVEPTQSIEGPSGWHLGVFNQYRGPEVQFTIQQGTVVAPPSEVDPGFRTIG